MLINVWYKILTLLRHSSDVKWRASKIVMMSSQAFRRLSKERDLEMSMRHSIFEVGHFISAWFCVQEAIVPPGIIISRKIAVKTHTNDMTCLSSSEL